MSLRGFTAAEVHLSQLYANPARTLVDTQRWRTLNCTALEIWGRRSRLGDRRRGTGEPRQDTLSECRRTAVRVMAPYRTVCS